MGREGKLFNFLARRKNRDEPFWWISLNLCNVCHQGWLIAQEERHNDDYYLKRLSNKEVDQIEKNNLWPADFDQYENLSRLGTNVDYILLFAHPTSSSGLEHPD